MSASLDYREFEVFAREIMSRHEGVQLLAGKSDGVPKLFDLKSPDGDIVGDVKLLHMVGGTRVPPAKYSNIAEHVWLLEKTTAGRKMLLFGGDRRVPAGWLKRFGHLATGVEFWFLSGTGEPERLNPSSVSP